MPEWQEQFPLVNRAVAPHVRLLPADQVEAILQEALGPEMTLASAEGFFDDIGRTFSRVAQVAAPVVQRALPGVVSGAMSGAALGPFGMLGGALLGGTASALGGGGAQAPRTNGAAPAPPGPAGAVGQLLGSLGSPTVQQALMSMLLGQAGSPTAPTRGGGQAPVGAITNLLGMLAGRASAEWESIVPSAEAESTDEGIDVGSPEMRASALLEQLLPFELDAGEADESWIDELYDELDLELAEDWPAGEDEAWSMANG